MNASEPRTAYTIRKNVVRPFGEDVPPTAQLLLEWAMRNKKGAGMLAFAVPELPPSVNSMYDSNGARRRRTVKYENFITLVAVGIGAKRSLWRPRGAVMVMIFLQSPHWITQRHEIRDMDGDNRIKTLLDSIQHATGVPDHTNWEYHCYKVCAKTIQTSVYMFDLGDVIDWHT